MKYLAITSSGLSLLMLLLFLDQFKRRRIIAAHAADQAHALQKNLEMAMQNATHRMRNNFQLISSMISLEMRRFAGDVSPDVVFRAMQARVDVLAFVDGMFFDNHSSDNIEIPAFLEAVREYLSTRYDRTKVALQIDVSGTADMATARALAFVFNELIGACAASKPTLQGKLAAIEAMVSTDELIFKIYAQKVDQARAQIGATLSEDCVLQLGGRFFSDLESQAMKAASWRIELPHTITRCACQSTSGTLG
jgi:hypothetical protein